MRVGVQRIVFGLVVPSTGGETSRHVDAFTAALSNALGIPVQRRDAASYEALAADVREGRADVAWLPPIVFVRLSDVVRAVGSIVRGDRSPSYDAALVVRADARVTSMDKLRGLRAGWVDRWSAAGYVIPRVSLLLHGLDPRSLFRSETFHGSHRSTIKALVERACDVVGTYARKDANGSVTSGGWTEVRGADVRVVATFGAIPPDVVAVRAQIADRLLDPLTVAFSNLCASTPELMSGVFNGKEFRPGLAEGYGDLRTALTMATGRGLFDAV